MSMISGRLMAREIARRTRSSWYFASVRFNPSVAPLYVTGVRLI